MVGWCSMGTFNDPSYTKSTKSLCQFFPDLGGNQGAPPGLSVDVLELHSKMRQKVPKLSMAIAPSIHIGHISIMSYQLIPGTGIARTIWNMQKSNSTFWHAIFDTFHHLSFHLWWLVQGSFEAHREVSETQGVRPRCGTKEAVLREKSPHRRNDMHQPYINNTSTIHKPSTHIHQKDINHKKSKSSLWISEGRCACLHWHCCTRWNAELHMSPFGYIFIIQWLIQWVILWFLLIFTHFHGEHGDFFRGLPWSGWELVAFRARSRRSRCVCCDPFPGLTILDGTAQQIWWINTIKSINTIQPKE